MNCALCNEINYNDLSVRDAKSFKSLLISICNNCGLVQQRPLPTVNELKIYYSHTYRKDYKKTYSPKSKHIYRAGKVAAQRIKFLIDAGIQSGSLLDVGAGGGEFVYLTKLQGFKSKGIEPSVGYSEFAQSNYDCNIMTRNLDKELGKYDVVTLFHVLEHLPSPLKAFEKLYSLLSESGKLLIEVPWIETTDASPHNIYFKAHIFYFSVETLISAASQFFDVVKVDTESNLKILFKTKKEPSEIKLPTPESVDLLYKRLSNKGWLEYLFKGKGLLKPAKKIANIISESKVKNLPPQKILENISLKYI